MRARRRNFFSGEGAPITTHAIAASRAAKKLMAAGNLLLSDTCQLFSPPDSQGDGVCHLASVAAVLNVFMPPTDKFFLILDLLIDGLFKQWPVLDPDNDPMCARESLYGW